MRHSSISRNRAKCSTGQFPLQQFLWPSCKQPNITNNSVFPDPCNKILEIPKTCFSKSTSKFSTIYVETEDVLKDESLETIIQGAKSSTSERLFFEPGQSKAISRNGNEFEGEKVSFKESVVVVMDSKNPYGDFKKSMQDMIESNGLNDLENLFGWFLKMNDKIYHGFIVEAFVDMFLEFAVASTSSSSSHSSSSLFSAEHPFISCSCCSSVLPEVE